MANRSIPGDALLLAAAVTYLGPFGPDVRLELLQKWHKLCLTGEMNMEPEDPCATIFSDSSLTCDRCVAIPVSKTFQLALNRILGLDLHQVHGDFADLIRSVLLWGHRFAWSQRCPLLAGQPASNLPLKTWRRSAILSLKSEGDNVCRWPQTRTTAVPP